MNGDIVPVDKGNTHIVAERLADRLDADLFHIEKVGGYPYGYRDTVEIAKVEWHNDARPEVSGRVEHMDAYDTLVLGYPNWCNTMPKAVCTFLESYDLTDKRIVPFCTNEGSGLGSSVDDLRRICPHSKVLEGTPIHGAEAATVTDEIDRIVELAVG